ncbi:MAG: LysR substrate-binding domain-containing protein [Clostridiaceae bacterium]
MHIESLKYFYEVSTLKSISKAANNSHISQSALSQQIQKLEDYLNCRLLQRSNKGVEITEQGKLAIKYIENIIKNYDKMLEEISNFNNKDSGITIEACCPMATYALPCTLYDMKKKFPNHNYRMSTNVSSVIEQNVVNGIFDIGFIHGKPQDETLSYYDISDDKLVLVANNECNIKTDITGRELLKYPLIILDDRLMVELQDKLGEYLKSWNHQFNDINVLFRLDSAEAVKATVMKGYGISFLPYMSVKKELYKKELKLVNVEDFDITYKVYLVHRKDEYMDNAVAEFIKFFKKIGKKSFC